MAGALVFGERVPPQRGGLAVATGRIAGHAKALLGAAHLVYPTRDLEPGAVGHRRRDDVEYHPVGVYPDSEATLRALAETGRRLVRARGLDVVHGIYATRAGYLAALVGAEASVASVVSLRGNDLDRGLYRSADLPFLQFALTRATAVTGVSRAISRSAERFSGRVVRHVTNSVDVSRFTACGQDNTLRAALGVGRSTTLGFLGEMREKKGMQFLLPAVDVLHGRGLDVRLILIGGVREEMRPQFDAFEKMAPEAFARIHVVDYVRDAARLSSVLGQCDLMVFPSLYDGTPNAMLEAMACARPILASDAGGQADLILHGETGALLPVEDLDRLPEAIEEMLGLGADALARMGRAARAHVETAHTSQAEREAYGQVYAEARAVVEQSEA